MELLNNIAGLFFLVVVMVFFCFKKEQQTLLVLAFCYSQPSKIQK